MHKIRQNREKSADFGGFSHLKIQSNILGLCFHKAKLVLR